MSPLNVVEGAERAASTPVGTTEEDIIRRAEVIHGEGTGWKKTLAKLKREFSSVPQNLVHEGWKNAKDNLADTKVSTAARPDESVYQSSRIHENRSPVIQKKPKSVPDRPSGIRTGQPTFSLSNTDEGLLGLALLTKELRQRWDWKSLGDLGDLGTWRAEGRHAPLGSDRWSIRQWAQGGGQGEYRLEPGAVRVFLSNYGLNPERVLVDLKDMGITRCDPRHSTKLVRMDGESGPRRMVVLPDGYVRRRSSMKLGSEVGKQMGRELRHSGFYKPASPCSVCAEFQIL